MTHGINSLYPFGFQAFFQSESPASDCWGRDTEKNISHISLDREKYRKTSSTSSTADEITISYWIQGNYNKIVFYYVAPMVEPENPIS